MLPSPVLHANPATASSRHSCVQHSVPHAAPRAAAQRRPCLLLPPPASTGATWADQALNARRYINHGWTLAVLLVVTAIFIVASLLPLLDPWYTAFALLTGGGGDAGGVCSMLAVRLAAARSVGGRVGPTMPGRQPPSPFPRGHLKSAHAGHCCCTTPPAPAGLVGAPVLLLLPRARRGRPKARRWVALQVACAALVAAAAACGAAGVALKADVGSQAAFLADGSCVTFGRWQCLPAGASPNGCRVEAQASGPSLIYCPSVRSKAGAGW